MTSSEKTLKALRSAVQVSPDNAPLRQHLADTLMSFGQTEEAATEYGYALALLPNSQELKLKLAQAFYQQGKHSQAIVLVEELLKSPDASAQSHLLYAKLLLDLGNTEQAGDRYRQAIQMDSTFLADPTLAARFGTALRSPAFSNPESAIALPTDRPTITFNGESHGLLGLVLLLQTSGYDSTHVLPHFRAALRLNPQLDFARYGVAEVLKSRFLPYRLLVRWGRVFAIGIITLLGVCLVGLSGGTGIPEIILLVSLSLLVIVPSLANVMLRFHPLGRFALAPEQVWASTWIGSSLVGLLLSTVLYFATKNIGWIASAVICGILIFLVAEVEVISFPRFQKWMQRLTIALATSGFLGSLGLIMLDATKRGADFIDSASRLPEPLYNLFAVCMLAGSAITLLLFVIGLPVARSATAIPESIADWQRYRRRFKRWRGQSKRS